MIKTELFTKVDVYTYTNNMKILLSNLKIILLIGFTIFLLISLIDINYVVKTKKLLRKSREEFGEELINNFFETIQYNLSETPRQVYYSLVDYVEDLRKERGL